MTEITDRAGAFVGLRALLDACPCVSPPGCRARESASTMSTAAATLAVDHARALEALAAHRPTLFAELERALVRVSDCADVFVRLDASGRLAAADFFRIQQLLAGAAELAAHLPSGDARWAPPEAPDSWLDELDPSGRHRGFSVQPAHHAELGLARDALAGAESRLRAARAAQREVLELATGVHADRSGQFAIRPATLAPTLLAELGDRIRLVRSTAFEAILEPVASAEIAGLESEVAALREHVELIEERVLTELSARFRARLEKLREVDEWVGRVDFARARSLLRQRWSGCWPGAGDGVALVGARLPQLSGAKPVDLCLKRAATVLVGPNMGGKTSALRLVATAAVLATMAFPVCAESAALGTFDRIDAVWDDGRETKGLSTFGREVAALVDALGAEGRVLLVVDEPARGTNPVEGTALAESICEVLAGRSGRALVATHLPVAFSTAVARLRIAGLEDIDDGAIVAAIETEDWRATLARVMDYRVVDDDGSDAPRDALRIARLLGLPPALVDDAAARIAAGTQVRRSRP